MKWLLVAGTAGIVFTAATSVSADEARPIDEAAPVVQSWSWTGPYVGAHVGAGWGKAIFSDPFGPSIYGNDVDTPAFLGGLQAGYNWQLPGTPWVFGAEADVSRMVSDGTNTCLAYSGFFGSANCRARPQLSATFAGRVGYAAGPAGRSLLYLKGGLAGVLETFDVATNAFTPPYTTSTTVWKWGGTVGAGIEQALTPAWSMKFEYGFMGFGAGGVPAPGSFVQPPGAPLTATAPATSSVSQDMHVVKLGLNYRFGMGGGRAGWPAASSSPSETPTAAMPLGWEAELGGRYWLSWGRFQKDLGSTSIPSMANVLNSRLTYNSTANSGEFFGRVESPWNVFAKGFIGAGTISAGSLNDEDWFAFPTAPYSNTLSSVLGTINYATADLGYNLFRTQDYKLGLFAGYNYYTENKTGHGCAQFANIGADCASWFPTSVHVIVENNTWQALRVGVNGEIRLLDSLKLGADVAYLPYVKFDGSDNHLLRGILSPEWGTGNGVQLEAVLSYYVTPGFSVGVGGRYWAMWTTDAYVAFGGTPCPCPTLPSKAERYGVFFQASYRFAQPAVARE